MDANEILEYHGVDSVDQLFSLAQDSVQSGHCNKCDFTNDCLEPDAEYPCPECDGTVSSLMNLIIAGRL